MRSTPKQGTVLVYGFELRERISWDAHMGAGCRTGSTHLVVLSGNGSATKFGVHMLARCFSPSFFVFYACLFCSLDHNDNETIYMAN